MLILGGPMIGVELKADEIALELLVVIGDCGQFVLYIVSLVLSCHPLL